MNSRMERYKIEEKKEEETSKTPVSSRVSRNNSLYQGIKTNELSRVRNNDNIKIIENSGKTIDLDKIKRYISGINNEPKITRRSVKLEEIKKETTPKKEEIAKDYDINSVIERAKQTREIDYERERHKKLRNTEYEILNKIKMYEEPEEELLENLNEQFNTDERTLIDLINTVTIHKGDINLLEELMGDDETDKMEPINKELEKGEIKEEINKVIEKEQEEKSKELNKIELTQELTKIKDKKTKKEENTFFTNSMTFGKEDFEGFDELEKSVKKNSIVSTILIIILIISIIVTLLIMANYVFNLGLF